jgi:hypothetical protein
MSGALRTNLLRPETYAQYERLTFSYANQAEIQAEIQAGQNFDKK